MAKSRYSIEEKKNLVMAYREATGEHGFINTEKVARWCNETYMLVEKLHGRDFRRPQEMKDWIEEINGNIAFKLGPPKTGGMKVITASLIDIGHIIKTCRNADQLRGELQKANRRFQDVIDTNQMLAKNFKEENKMRIELQRDLEILKSNHDRALKELKVKERKWRSDIKELKKQLDEKKKIEKELLQYMYQYIADPIAADHFANELRLLTTYPGREVVLPEHLKGLANDDRPFGTIISAFDEWIGAMNHNEDEEMDCDEDCFEDEEIEVEPKEAVIVMTEGETTALNMLEDL